MYWGEIVGINQRTRGGRIRGGEKIRRVILGGGDTKSQICGLKPQVKPFSSAAMQFIIFSLEALETGRHKRLLITFSSTRTRRVAMAQGALAHNRRRDRWGRF